MTAKEKAEQLVNSYRVILMSEDTECGNEILCTSIAKQCAIIAVDEIIEQNNIWIKQIGKGTNNYYEQVKTEIENL